MAVVERGKGRRRQAFEIVRQGAMLRSQETESGEQRLPGYRRFASEDAATTALSAEVRAHLADGMQPADEEARAIAAEASQVVPAVPSLPVRCDLGIYNEANGFVVTSRKMSGKTLEEGSPEWVKAVKRGDMLPVQLVQGDSFVIRVVAGAALSEQESEEWVARVDWHLNVPDGRLCVTGGSVFTTEGYDPEADYCAQFVGEVAIPKGRYRASLYTHLHGVNGESVIDHLAGGYDRGEPLEDWFARTRPGMPLPEWDEAREPVAFLLHLEPVDAAPKSGLSELPEDGWFGGAENARKPERCPLGIEAKDVVRRRDPESGEWTYVREVFPMLAQKWKTEPGALDGGETVLLPLAVLARAARIAWFGSQAMFELRLKPPGGAAVHVDGTWPEGVVAVERDGIAQLLFSADLDPSATLARIRDLGEKLASLPDGTLLDLGGAPYEQSSGVPAGGWLWLRGPIRAGHWRIARAHPTASRPALKGALALAAEVEGTAIAVRDPAEGEAILARAKRTLGPLLDRNRPQLEQGAFRFKEPGEEVGLLGVAVFAQRFASTWPVHETEAPDADADGADDEDDDRMFPTSPIQGALISTAPAGRTWHQTMTLLLSQKIADAIQAQAKGLRSGFRLVGDLMTPSLADVAFQGYARTDGRAIAWFSASYPDRVALEIVSFFASGGMLITSRDANARDAENVYRQGLPEAASADLVAHHDRRLAELAGTLGDVEAIGPGLAGFAAALERVIGQA